MNYNNVVTQLNTPTSLLVSMLGDIPAGDSFHPNFRFLVKNITEENITLTVRMAKGGEEVTTIFYPGWNPEILDLITSTIEADTLQYGL